MSCRVPLPLAALIAALVTLTAHLPEVRADDPIVVSPEVMKDFAQYQARKKPLYFAVSTDGRYSWYSYCIDYNCQATQSYRTEALKRCEDLGGVECVIFAVGGDIQVEYRVSDAATVAAGRAKACEIEAFATESPATEVVAALAPSECNDFRRFGFYQDFKAFASTDPRKVKSAWGWSYRWDSPEKAMKSALEECASSRKNLSVPETCELFAIGDIVVQGMTAAQQRAAAEVYRKNRDATNADVPPGG